jgi:hypothetical protein
VITFRKEHALVMADDHRAGDDRGQQAIVAEFTYLLEKSKQLFNGVRDLPQFGQKHWQGYFARTFDVFTRVWTWEYCYCAPSMYRI